MGAKEKTRESEVTRTESRGSYSGGEKKEKSFVSHYYFFIPGTPLRLRLPLLSLASIPVLNFNFFKCSVKTLTLLFLGDGY